MKILLLIAAFIFACSKPTVNHSAAITESKSETQHSLQIRSGQSVLEAATERQTEVEQKKQTNVVTGADSIITERTLPDGTTERTKIYNPKSEQETKNATSAKEQQKDTTTLKINETEIKKEGIDKAENLEAKEKKETKGSENWRTWMVYLAIIGLGIWVYWGKANTH